MPLVLVNNGEEDWLNMVVNKAAPQNLVLRLFQNNHTPAETDVAADYTEANFTGYSAATLTGASWTVTPGAPSEASFAQQTFTSSAAQAAQSIYGYFLTQATSGRLQWAERFPSGPYPIANDGDSIGVTPKITLD
jgi:hypothetical protein